MGTGAARRTGCAIGPGIIHRLLEEVAAAGVTQVIVVSACATSARPAPAARDAA